MSDQNQQTANPESGEQVAESVTDFASVLVQHAKGTTNLEASNALTEVVSAALMTEKKGTVTVKVEVTPAAHGTVTLKGTITKKVPEDPASSVWFADDSGNLSRDNRGMYFAGH